ncbi:Calcium channel YVC1 [Tolypocladium paradoxum]|uniref:Calcium channel YVC1 n=1 Tax=Tolypocladium paradoxum TaxID=94208 RepID=A0A2S4KVI2_9HYPO|nr:Calcium channel YVC1 [Tolypocladium paradoxum]
MFSSLLRRPSNGFRPADIGDVSLSPSSRPPPRLQFAGRTHATADFTEADDDEEEDSNDQRTDRFGHEEEGEVAPDDGPEDEADEDGGQKALPVLPLFSATHLDSLPIYSITHAIRIIVSARTETTLTWEQLRSPQVSQFLVKPMQQQIRTQHFSRATLYALMANCLQFTKEGQRYAANAGNSNTRAKVCELLALKLLKEYTTRELIDALAYDFYPLQGLPGAQPPSPSGRTSTKAKQAMTASRTSTLEVAIRASAKHFLAHPVVIQQLEAIWNGAITFYSSADSLHREAPPSPFQGMNGNAAKPDARTPLLGTLPPKQDHFHVPPGRRAVMLYDPRQASMLKLSRLRVPRYRSFLSTLSLAVLIGLFLSVLAQRSVQITGLELVFWFWSAGFMLDELVGFNEQGFALYIMSFWNIFDLGILVLLIGYYCMRAYGVFLVDPHHWNDMAYDVLAANAILLLPRIFSILDHYQYFSQLLIAFRLMAVDLAAVFVLVLIMCSGFYVFFTLSASANESGDVAYKIFQILMGFTPAAWDVWPRYNWLARILMMMFLIICHFLVVTILITVLTNSFMTIASNATEEHQFLFAINTISMVKNDALFSYIAPSNIFAWLLMPLRYCMPLKHFVWLNRTIIKVTHFPVLFCIYLYERFWLAPSMYEPTDLVENHGRSRPRTISFRDPVERTAMFSPNLRVREESVAGFHKDRALEEVFRRLPESATLRTQRRNERRKTQTAIRNWMDQNDDAGVPLSNWPTLDNRALPEWQRRLSVGWDRPSHFRRVSDVRSTASDPADFMSNPGASFSRGQRSRLEAVMPEYKDQTDADGDDELVTNDEDEDDAGTNADRSHQYAKYGVEEEDYFTTPMAARSAKLASSHGSSAKALAPSPRQGNQRRGMHSRTLSTNTILYNPEELPQAHSSSSKSPPKPAQGRKPGTSGRSTGANTPAQVVRRSSPRRTAFAPSSHPRPIVPPRGMTETGGVSRTAMLSLDPRDRLREARRLSSVDLSIPSDHFGPDDTNAGMAGSFQTQMAMAMMKDQRLRVAGGVDVADRDRMGRLVLARMKTLEESFAEVVREMRDLKNSSTGPHSRRNSSAEEVKGTGIDSSGYGRPKRAKGDATPKKGYGRRPASRRSMKEGKVGMAPRRDPKGKGKEIAYTSTGDEGEMDDGFQRRGSSM